MGVRLFLTIEAQNAFESGLADIFNEVNKQLSFVTDRDAGLESVDNYGTEFRVVSIIPTCVDDAFWSALGWKERIKIWNNKREADIRLRMDYSCYMSETYENRRLLFIKTIIASIRSLQERSRGDFKGELLVSDILRALHVQHSQLDNL